MKTFGFSAQIFFKILKNFDFLRKFVCGTQAHSRSIVKRLRNPESDWLKSLYEIIVVVCTYIGHFVLKCPFWASVWLFGLTQSQGNDN